MTSEDDYRSVIRSMIQHEDELRAQRLGWLFTLNGFLFAALGFAWGDDYAEWLVAVLGAVGVAAGISAAAAMTISNHAVRALAGTVSHPSPPYPAREDGRGMTPAERDEPPVVGARREDLDDRTFRVLLYPWLVLPWILTGAWIVLLIARIVISLAE